MHFSDQSHINQVRDALWKRSGGASVMVGAGFSRNASSAIPSGHFPPTLRGLTQAFYNELYPRGAHEGREDASTDLVEARSFPVLAQEYEVAFGRSRLHRFLQGLIRDNELIPTGIHERLLRLPWNDVFTTNWDTLLERSIASVSERKYSILRNRDEIPFANRPRVVKLHGSFPAHFPLICTQEDYRTYPAKFAPFVNTVQQAMMETMFLLVGFKGEDPNFVHWTGWIRDNLGESAPKIYLAGWLELSPHRRRMLEQRNIVSIDLARHVKANKWPEHLRHNYATKWILHTLECGRPYVVTDWPSTQLRDDLPIPDDLEPVAKIKADQPVKEPGPSSESDSVNLAESVNGIVSIWAHNRTLYPGWLAVPVSVRDGITLNTDDWEPRILSALPKLDPMLQVKAIHELMWRREILLDPISSNLESAAKETLQQIDRRGRTVRGTSAAEEWGAVREAYRCIALALVTTVRRRLDREGFQKLIEILQEQWIDDPEVAQRIHHERCLWAIYSLDYKSLSGSLGDWLTEDCDPVWMVRKATLLYESNRIDDASDLANRALSAIRRIPDDGKSVAGPSREGWSLALASVLESIPGWMRSGRSNAERSLDLSRFYKRWRELASLKCDLQSDIQGYANALAMKSESEDVPPFDFAVKTIQGIQFSNVARYRYVAAHRAIRLSEVAGLPTFSFDTLKPAVDELSASDLEMAVRLMLRTLNNDGDDLLKRVLSRPRIAMMPVKLAQELTNSCNGVISYALPRIGRADTGGRIQFWTDRMRVAMEVLSRLVVRLDSKGVEETFRNALTAYQTATIVQTSLLRRPLCNTLIRSWQALPNQRRSALLLDLLSAPIFGVRNTPHSNSLYPLPRQLFQEQFSPPDRTDHNERRWQRIVSQMIHGLNEGGGVRERASLWVFKIASWKRLTEAEACMVGEALWQERFRNSAGLPGQTSLLDWVLMVLPEPEIGSAEHRFRQKWLSDRHGTPENARDFGDALLQVGAAISGLKTHRDPLALSREERRYLIDIVEQWSIMSAPNDVGPFGQLLPNDPIVHALEGLRSILTEVQIPARVAKNLYQKMESLNDIGIPAYGLIPGLLKALPDRFGMLALAVRSGLISAKSDLAEGAARGLTDWLTSASETAPSIQLPPDDLVREIGIIIATRRMDVLGPALATAKWVFDNGSDAHKEAIRDLALRGLEYLSVDLKYDRKRDHGSVDLPRLRWRTVHLALSMANHGLQSESAVVSWLNSVETDPLPEVRYATGSVSVRQQQDLTDAIDGMDSPAE